MPRRFKPQKYENTVFFRTVESGFERISQEAPKRTKNAVLLTPLKSVAISPFAFPFNNILRVREALKLQALPYASGGEMELFPAVVEKTSRSSGGVVWFVPCAELDAIASMIAGKSGVNDNEEIDSGARDEGAVSPLSGIETKVWPAPLSLVSKVHGEGLTVWVDERDICSILWRGGAPVLYRWKPRVNIGVEAEIKWFSAFCESKSEEVGEVFVLDATDSDGASLLSLPEIIRESLSLYPWIDEVNLSLGALDSALTLEQTVRKLSLAACWLLVMGLFVLTGNAIRWYEARRGIDDMRDKSSEMYRAVFDPSRTGRIPDPLGLARSKIAELKGEDTAGRPINQVFDELGGIFKQNPSMDVTIDSVRFTLEGVDYTGSTSDAATPQEFQNAWADIAGNALLQNVQNAPGVGYRFDLTVKW
ncbi:hypothetical protein AGMMS50276_08140 [Synergistales bacterium]|nr:hypothetical protein AGMMS50276_08140 [Synergistales bacterium]